MIDYTGAFEKIAGTRFVKDKTNNWEDRAYLDNAIYDIKPGAKHRVNLPTGELIKRERKMKGGTAFELLSPLNSKTTSKRHTIAAIGNDKKTPGTVVTEYDRPATKGETTAVRLNRLGNTAALGGAAGVLASTFINKKRTRNKVLNLASLAGIGGTLTSLGAHRYLTESGEGAKDALRQVGTTPDASGKTKVKYRHYKDKDAYRISRQILRQDDSYNLHNEVFIKRPRYEVEPLTRR